MNIRKNEFLNLHRAFHAKPKNLLVIRLARKWRLRNEIRQNSDFQKKSEINLDPFCIFFSTEREIELFLLGCNKNLADDYFLVEYRIFIKRSMKIDSTSNISICGISAYCGRETIYTTITVVHYITLQYIRLRIVSISDYSVLRNKSVRKLLPSELIWKIDDKLQLGHFFLAYYWRAYYQLRSLQFVAIGNFQKKISRNFGSFSDTSYSDAMENRILPDIAYAKSWSRSVSR